MTITIITIPHHTQRYETIGDWQWSKKKNQDGSLDESLLITVSDLGDWKKNSLIAIHELVEVLLCKARGITQEQVDDFDLEYEARRLLEDTTNEPGDSPMAPYKNEHAFATKIERMIAEELGINWEEYEKTIYSL